jgi:hypothetical protein
VALLAIAVGLLIGLSLGALGGGGSILTVPALVYLLGQSPHQATTASLLVVGVAAVAGAITHARAGRVRFRAGAAFGLLGIAGAYAGSQASAAVPPDLLLAGFSLLMLTVAAAMISRRSGGQEPAPDGITAGADLAARSRPGQSPDAAATPSRARPDIPLRAGSVILVAERPSPAGRLTAAAQAGWNPPAGLARRFPAAAAALGAGRLSGRALLSWQHLRWPALIAAAASAVGFVTGFFGVGGGFLVVPVLVLLLGFDMAAAAGTSLLVISIDGTAALAARAGHGSLALDWPIIGVFAAAAVLGALAGGRLAGRVSPGRLNVAFTVLIVMVACYTFARSIPALA